MVNFSAAQQFVSQLLPNVTNGAVNIIQALQGGAGVGGGASKNAFGGSSLFDSELGAKSHNPKVEIRRDENNAPVQVSRPREDRAPHPDKTPTVKEVEQRDTHYDTGGVQPLDKDVSPDQALPPTSDKMTIEQHDASAGQAGQDIGAQGGALSSDPLIGSTGDVLAQAQDLLDQIQAFAQANPTLAGELQAIFAPIVQSLQQIISQFSTLDVNTPVTASNLPSSLNTALGKLDQFAQAFNRQQAGGAFKLDASLQTDVALPEDMLQAIKTLKQADAKSMGMMNDLAKSIANFEAATSLGKNAAAGADKAATSNAPANATPQTLNVVVNQPMDAAVAKPAQAANTEVLTTAGNQSGADQSSSNNNQNSQSQQQAFANGQAAQQAQNALSGQKLNAESIRPATSEAGANTASSSTNSAGQPAGAGQSSSIAGRENASFERALNQASKATPSEQIQFQMKQMVKDGRSVMVVKLDPPELGQLEIRMQISRSGRTEVLISVEKPQTLELLQKDSRLLTEALQDAGLKADSGSLSFNLRGGNDSPAGQQHPKNIYPALEEQFDEQMLSVVSETYSIEPEHGVNIHA